MDKFRRERVLSVHHWNDGLFSFRTTRDPGLRFESGQFIMIGLPVDGKPLMRAYSFASAAWEEELEFFSIKVPDGPLTSRLQHLQVGDEILLSKKPTGTLLISDLHPGKRLYLLGTGTGLAPYLSIIKDPETYERFDSVIVAHGVRLVEDLAYREHITDELPNHELLGDMIRGRLLYYPAVSREPFIHSGRLTDLLDSGQMTSDLGLPDLDPENDRVMLCGSMAMLKDFRELLDERGFQVSPSIGQAGDYVFERAFVG
ncbi:MULTISPECIES: ferredoxin--NADP reductase [unclassified Wenzhouxiangella]|uniref:ferredoxin--NADP reductase n=1 Tax=unclassified Wenzhouxiangella TaxID=2613841 RepID=UPI000E32C09F|nr:MULTISPECIES: ferredoxin--NADP reductase [unclassified Wenzhouxiangella]RFF26881.1 ferredoxin--NADP reductase [Wenzhouxiangella sp. 15181]RFP68465.1 ferredoxin--NADP reductase [Wenzhouxiangella sp. 15190]